MMRGYAGHADRGKVGTGTDADQPGAAARKVALASVNDLWTTRACIPACSGVIRCLHPF
jgi:hypothetical protein